MEKISPPAAIDAGNDVLAAWRNSRRLDRLIARYLITLVVVLSVVLVAFSSLTYLDNRTKHIDGIRLSAGRLMQLQLDEETGVRGYDVTGSQAFLQPFAYAQQPIARTIDGLTPLVEENAAASAALAHFALTHESWLRDVARPVIAGYADPRNAARQRAGKDLVDSQRADIARIDAIYAREYDRVMAIKSSIRYVSTFIVLVSILMIAGTGYFAELRSASREEALLRTILDERDTELRRSEWRTKIIAMLAHDFRSSLGVIRAYTDMLQSFPEKRDEDAPYDGIRKAIEDLTIMSEEALLMARMSNNALTICLRPQRIYDIVDEAARRYEGEREIVVASSDAEVIGDRSYLVRVFDNLIGNAVKYSPSPSPIRIDIRRLESEVEVAVSDRGRGIDPADLPHVFEEFWRAKNAGERTGSGIGLFIVKKIVDAHRGSAKIESNAGEGTTVRVFLPSPVAALRDMTDRAVLPSIDADRAFAPVPAEQRGDRQPFDDGADRDDDRAVADER